MARPKKKKVDYFPHECSHGKTMTILEKKYGNDGYAFWFKLLETLGNTRNHFIDLTNDEDMIYLSSETNLSEDKCIEILDLLARLDAIDSELWESKRIVWCENFLENIRDAYTKRETDLPQKPALSNQKKGSRTENEQSKEKESKQNNSKKDNNNESNDSEESHKEEIQEIFDFWVEQEAGTKHVKLKDSIKRHVRARLKDGYDIQYIKQAIQNLAVAYNDDSYYWSHKWGLDEFCKRGGGTKLEKFHGGIEWCEDDNTYDDQYDNQAQKEWHEDAV